MRPVVQRVETSAPILLSSQTLINNTHCMHIFIE